MAVHAHATRITIYSRIRSTLKVVADLDAEEWGGVSNSFEFSNTIWRDLPLSARLFIC